MSRSMRVRVSRHERREARRFQEKLDRWLPFAYAIPELEHKLSLAQHDGRTTKAEMLQRRIRVWSSALESAGFK